MASLNTLRTRGGAIITIVIGIALLSFVLGDFSPRGCAEHNVGIIDGKKIDYMEFSSELDAQTLQFQVFNQGASPSSEQNEYIKELAWRNLIEKYAFKPGYRKLGLTVSDDEEIDMVSGVYISPVLIQQFSNPQTGMFDPEMLFWFHSEMKKDPSGMEQYKWEQLKTIMIQERVQSKFIEILSSAVAVNDLEVAAGVEGENNSFEARIIPQFYSDLPDSAVNVTDKDIRAYYNKYKSTFLREESRGIEYVVFDMLPSEQDYKESEEHINDIAEEFKESSDPMNYAALNSDIRPEEYYFKESEVRDNAMLAAIWDKPDAMYGPVIASDVYTVARLGDMRMLPDTVGLKYFILSAEERELADSLVGALKQGADFTEVAATHALNKEDILQAGTDIGRIPLAYLQHDLPILAEELVKAQRGEIVIAEDLMPQVGNIIQIAELTYKSQPVKKAQLAIIRYNVEPSSETRRVIYDDAMRFQVAAGDKYDTFKKAVSEQSIIKRAANVSTSEHKIHGFNDSRELVRWAFSSKRGSISEILTVDDNYVIAALTTVIEQGYASVNDVADEIVPVLMREKKSEKLAENFNGSTLSEVANGLDAEIIEAENINLNNTHQINGIGPDGYLIGAICSGTQIGKLVGPVKGNLGVYMVEVDNVNTSAEATVESERVKAQSIYSKHYIGLQAEEALFEVVDVVDRRLKYF